MSIKNWPKQERLRERLLEHGAHHLSDAELLAICLRTGTRGKSALDLAHELLLKHETLQNILHCPLEDFLQISGLGKAKFAELQAIVEIHNRYLFNQLKTIPKLAKHQSTQAFLKNKLAKRTRETFACLFLDNKNQLIAYKELFFGSIQSADIYPRELIREALHHNASGVIFAHNHTSGDPTPSQADIELTQYLKKALELVEIRVLDHIVVGQHGTASISLQ